MLLKGNLCHPLLARLYLHLIKLRTRLTNLVYRLRSIIRSEAGDLLYRYMWGYCMFTYGSPTLYEFALTVLGIKLLHTCKRVAYVACLPVCRTVLTGVMQVLLDAPPLDLRVVQHFSEEARICIPLVLTR